MNDVILSVRGLVTGYPGGPAVLDGLDLTVDRRQRLVLLGANGSGKTTLLRTISGALRPRGGQILVDGTPLAYSRAALRTHRQKVQLVLQDPDDQLFSASVTQDVSFGPMNLGLAEDEVRARVTEALELLGVAHLADRPTHMLSYGERKRVATAGAMAMRPQMLILDEPTAGLDPAAVIDMTAAIDRLHDAGTTMVIATHDVDFALAWADSAAVVVDRRVVQGGPAEILGDDDLVDRARLAHPWALVIGRRLRELGVLSPDRRPIDVASMLAALPLTAAPAPTPPA